LIAIGLGQTIQIPISATASLLNLASGRIDLTLGTVLAAALAIGIAVGAPLAHALPQQTLRRVLAFAMVAAGFAMLGNLAARVVIHNHRLCASVASIDACAAPRPGSR
jgi:uncharacterized membrane protein YfcA